MNVSSTGNAYLINSTSVLNSTTLGSGSTQSVGRPVWIPLSGGTQEAIPQPSGAMQAGYLFGYPVFFTEKQP